MKLIQYQVDQIEQAIREKRIRKTKLKCTKSRESFHGNN